MSFFLNRGYWWIDLIPENFDEIRSTLDEIIKLSSEQLLVSNFPISEKIRNRTLDSNSQIQELLKVINNLDPLVNNANKWKVDIPMQKNNKNW